MSSAPSGLEKRKAEAAGPVGLVRRDPAWLRATLIAVAVGFIAIAVVAPLANVFTQALANGIGAYFAALRDPDTQHAIKLTLIVAAIVVPLNVVFGIVSAWALTRAETPAKTFLTSLVDLPFSVSPVIAGLIFILIFGQHGYIGSWLRAHGIEVVFALPGIVIATIFVTFPFVTREVMPILQALGNEEEEAARMLGASPWQTFWHVTLPNIRWGVLYGAILCNARAMGEFGAVSVVSGKISGKTDTMPLLVEKLYNGYAVQGAFTVASLLAFLALITLALKTVLEWKNREALRIAAESELTGADAARRLAQHLA